MRHLRDADHGTQDDRESHFFQERQSDAYLGMPMLRSYDDQRFHRPQAELQFIQQPVIEFMGKQFMGKQQQFILRLMGRRIQFRRRCRKTLLI